MQRIYVAGAYSDNNVMGVLNNMRKGLILSTRAFLAGYAVFSPWLDYQFVFQCNDEDIKNLKVENFYKYSIAWLDVSDAMLLVPGWEDSYGTKKEIEYAEAHGIPIFYSLEELQKAVPAE